MAPITKMTRATRRGVRALSELTGESEVLDGCYYLDLPDDHGQVVGALLGPGGSLVEVAESDRPVGTGLRLTQPVPVERALTVFRPESPLRERFHDLPFHLRARAYTLLTEPDGPGRVLHRAQVIERISYPSTSPATWAFPFLGALSLLALPLALVSFLVVLVGCLQALYVVFLLMTGGSVDWSSALLSMSPGAGVVGVSLAVRRRVNRAKERRNAQAATWLTDDWIRVPVTDRRYRLVRELLLVAARIERHAGGADRVTALPPAMSDTHARAVALAWSVASGGDLTGEQLTEGLTEAGRVRDQVAAAIAQADRITTANATATAPETVAEPVTVPSPADDLRALADALTVHIAATDEVASADSTGRARATDPHPASERRA